MGQLVQTAHTENKHCAHLVIILPLPNTEQHPCRWDSKGALYVHALFFSCFPRRSLFCGGDCSSWTH